MHRPNLTASAIFSGTLCIIEQFLRWKFIIMHSAMFAKLISAGYLSHISDPSQGSYGFASETIVNASISLMLTLPVAVVVYAIRKRININNA